MVALRLVRSDREGEVGTGRAAEIETQVGRQALGGAGAESWLRLPAQLYPLVTGGRRCCHHCHIRLWGSVPTSYMLLQREPRDHHQSLLGSNLL